MTIRKFQQALIEDTRLQVLFACIALALVQTYF